MHFLLRARMLRTLPHRRNKIVNNMKTAISQEMKTVSIELPVSEYNFLKTLSKKMGWVTKLVKTKPVAKSELDLAIEDVKKGNVVSFGNVEDAINYLNS